MEQSDNFQFVRKISNKYYIHKPFGLTIRMDVFYPFRGNGCRKWENENLLWHDNGIKFRRMTTKVLFMGYMIVHNGIKDKEWILSLVPFLIGGILWTIGVVMENMTHKIAGWTIIWCKFLRFIWFWFGWYTATGFRVGRTWCRRTWIYGWGWTKRGIRRCRIRSGWLWFWLDVGA